MQTTSHTKDYLGGAVRRSAWSLKVQNRAAGTLELYLTAAGYVWSWSQKPEHLVPIAGVLDDVVDGAAAPIPYRFFDEEFAIGHILANTGYAFHGDCAMEALH